MNPEQYSRYGWQVLLIGGSSGVGKTMVARELARELSLPLLLLDDVRLAIQQTTTRQTHPDLHVFLDYHTEQWRKPETILADWIAVGNAMAKPLQAIINHHRFVPTVGAIMIEGDGILPVASNPFAGSNEVCTVFIVEEDEGKLLHNLRSRGRGFNEWDDSKQGSFAHASWLYGQWLAQEANKAGLPVINAQPQATLLARLRAIIGVE